MKLSKKDVKELSKRIADTCIDAEDIEKEITKVVVEAREALKKAMVHSSAEGRPCEHCRFTRKLIDDFLLGDEKGERE